MSVIIKIYILILFVNQLSIFAIACRRDTSREYKYVVRVCMKHMLQTHVFCVGVYFHKDWVVVSHRCRGFMKLGQSIWVVLGGHKMDCHTGDIRHIDVWTTHRTKKGQQVLLIRLDEPFPSESVRISLTKKIKGKRCNIYCSYRLLDPIEPITEDPNMCGKNFDMYPTVLQKCKEGPPNDYTTCGSATEETLHYYNSPVVCDEKLVGFLELSNSKQLVVYLLKSMVGSIYRKITSYATRMNIESGGKRNCRIFPVHFLLYLLRFIFLKFYLS